MKKQLIKCVEPSLKASGKNKNDNIRDASSELILFPGASVPNEPIKLRVNKQLRASEVRYRRLFEAARDGILILDPKSRKITDANPFMTELLGYTHAELLGKELWEIGLLKDEKASRAAFRELKRNRFVRYEDLPLQSKTGDTHQVEFVSNLYEEGEKTVAQCNIRDITQRKSAEDLIAEQAAFLNKARDAIIAQDLEGKILFWNKGAERLYGWTNGEAKDQNAGRLLYRDPHIFEEINKLILTKGEWTGELRHLTKTRKEITVETHWTLIKNRDGKPKSILAINMDVTEKKRIEAHVMRAQRMESQDAEMRTQQAEARSEQSESANLAKNQFLANMSHELRTPLNGIIGFTEFLIDGHPGPLKPKQEEYLGDVLNCAQHLLQLINDVLDLAKVAAGKMELHPEIFAVHKAVEEVAAIIKSVAQKKYIALSIEIGPELDAVMLDQRMFKQVLYNLLSNAIKFSNDCGVVGIHARRLDTHQLEIQIRDAGIGIKAEDINRLFTEFEQLDSGTARRFEGTGLGLALTKKIIELQGGHISVESDLGRGSVFTVVLPVMTEERKAA